MGWEGGMFSCCPSSMLGKVYAVDKGPEAQLSAEVHYNGPAAFRA